MNEAIGMLGANIGATIGPELAKIDLELAKMRRTKALQTGFAIFIASGKPARRLHEGLPVTTDDELITA